MACATARADIANTDPASTQLPSEQELEAAGAIIGEIYFDNQDIFDERDPRENRPLYRLANDLHIKTRESTLRSQLLFRSGEPYSRRIIRETERNLRRLDYLFDARVRPIAWDGENVDLLVVTRDVWSLNPGISYSRKGGAESNSIEIEEENLLGYGKSVLFSRESDVERTSLLVRWIDPNVWGSRWRANLAYSNNDDGKERSAQVERPFFSFDTRWSTGVTGADVERIEPRYDEGEEIDEFRHVQQLGEVRAGWSSGWVDGWTRRWLAGFRYDRNVFRPQDPVMPGLLPVPPNRTASYPWVGIEWIEDQYEEVFNLNQIGRTEDLYYGTSFRVQLGWSSEGFGATRDEAIFGASAGTSFRFTDEQSLFLALRSGGRMHGSDVVNAITSGTARYYWRWHPKRVFFFGFEGTATDELDPENQLFLGGDTDLRGYPYRYQSGKSRAQFTVEQRFYTDWYPFRLFNVGAAVFFDTGRVWGESLAGTEPRGWLKNVGAGLRLGNARSGFGSVIHIDLAVPLDSTGDIDDVQFVIDTKRSF